MSGRFLPPNSSLQITLHPNDDKVRLMSGDLEETRAKKLAISNPRLYYTKVQVSDDYLSWYLKQWSSIPGFHVIC